MNTNRIVLKAIAAAVLASTAGFAAASGTQTVPVKAEVKQVCKFDGAAADIDFGTIDPNADTGEKTVAVSVPYKCTKGFTPVVSKGAITALNAGGGNTMTFTVDDFTEAAGTGFSAAVNATSTARIAEAQYKNAAAGSYVGSIVLDINGGD